MKIKRKWASLLGFVLLTNLTAPAYSADDKLDQFFKSINLKELIANNRLLNLGAQFKKPTLSTTNVNDFNNFTIISVGDDTNSTYMVEFDKKQNKRKEKNFAESWMGTFPFDPSELPATTLQEGAQNVQTCMEDQGEPIQSRTLAQLHIYKTQRTMEIVYDYVFTDPNLPEGRCREYLYTPASAVDPKEKCEVGFTMPCHFDIGNPERQKK